MGLTVKCIREVKGIKLGCTYIIKQTHCVDDNFFYELEQLEGLYDIMLFRKVENVVKSTIKPSHYNSGKFDVIEFCNENNVEFWCGNVIKYCVRAGKKDKSKEIEDLQKASEYIRRRIEFLKNKGE